MTVPSTEVSAQVPQPVTVGVSPCEIYVIGCKAAYDRRVLSALETEIFVVRSLTYRRTYLGKHHTLLIIQRSEPSGFRKTFIY